jgi:biopolymer transport protein ExbD
LKRIWHGATIIRPEAAQAVALQNGTILIGVRPNDDIWMAKRQVELREVRQMVERARAENPEGSVVIVADKGSRIGTVTRVMDQVKMAGVQGIAISAEQPGG